LPRAWSLDEVRRDPVAAGRLFWDTLHDEANKATPPGLEREVRGLWIIDKLVGVTSFSEVRDSIQMWSLYAVSHTGFVLGFDGLHQSFANDRYGLWPVKYDDERPVLGPHDVWDLNFLLQKAARWSFESEWRFVAPLKVEAPPPETKIDAMGYPVHFWEFPTEQLKSVIIGARMGHDAQHHLVDAVRSNGSLSHVKILRARLDSRTFGITIDEAEP
jgi:hypothetical protein